MPRRSKQRRKGSRKGDSRSDISREMMDAKGESRDMTLEPAAAAGGQTPATLGPGALSINPNPPIEPEKRPSILSRKKERKHTKHQRHSKDPVKPEAEVPAAPEELHPVVSAIADAFKKVQLSLSAPADAEVHENAPAEAKETAPPSRPQVATTERRPSALSVSLDRQAQFPMQAYNPAAGMWMGTLPPQPQLFGPHAQFQPTYPPLPYTVPSLATQPFQSYAPGLIPTLSASGMPYLASPTLSMTGFPQNPMVSAQAPSFVPAPYNALQPYPNAPGPVLGTATAQGAAPTTATAPAAELVLQPTAAPAPAPAPAQPAAFPPTGSSQLETTTRKDSIPPAAPAAITTLDHVGETTGTGSVPDVSQVSARPSVIPGSDLPEVRSAAPEDTAAAPADEVMSPKTRAAKGRKHRRRRRDTTVHDLYETPLGDKQAQQTFNREVLENMVDSNTVAATLPPPSDDDTVSPPAAVPKSTKRGSRAKHRMSAAAFKSAEKSLRTQEDLTAATSAVAGDEAGQTSVRVPSQNNVVIDTEMAKRLLAALEKCEQQSPTSPPAGVIEHTCESKPQSTKEVAKPAEPKRPPKSGKAKERTEDFGSSEEFFEEINEEILEPEKGAKDGQRKRVVRRTTKSRRHNVSEQPWDDQEGWSDEIPTLLRWEDIQPQTSAGKGSAKNQPQGSWRRRGERDPDLLAEMPPDGYLPPHFEFGRPSNVTKGRGVARFRARQTPPTVSGGQRYPPRIFPFPRYPAPTLCCGTRPFVISPYDPRMVARPHEPPRRLRGFDYAGQLQRQPRPVLPRGIHRARGPVMPYPSSGNTAVRPAYGQRYPLPIRGVGPSGGRLPQTAWGQRPPGGHPGDVRKKAVINASLGQINLPNDETQTYQAHQAGRSFPQGLPATADQEPIRHQTNAVVTAVPARTPPQRSLTFETRLPNQDCHYEQAVGVPIGVTPWLQARGRFPEGTSTSRHGVIQLPRTRGNRVPGLSPRGRGRGSLGVSSHPGGLLPSTSAGCVVPCVCNCHTGGTHSVAQHGVSLEELLRREDEIRWDEQLRQRRWLLDDQMIRHDEQCQAFGERLDAQRQLLDTDAVAPPPCLNCSTAHL